MVAGQLELLMFTNLARLSTDMAQVKNMVGGTMKHVEGVIESATSRMKGAISGIFAGLSVAVLMHKVDSVTESMAHLQDVSEKTGASVEKLSQLQFFAGVSGSNIDAVATALAKLSKGMVSTGVEAAPTTQALKYLGLSAKDAAGNLKDPSDLFGEIAQELIKYEDGAGKAAIAQALFGKAGAEMLPTLKKMAELGAVEASVTKEQAQAAEDYQVALARLHRQKEIVWNQIVSAMLPSMQSLVDALLEASSKTDSLQSSAKGLASDGSIESWADKGAMAIAILIDGIKSLPKLFGVATADITVRAAQLDVLSKQMTVAMPWMAAAAKLAGKNPIDELNTALAARNIAVAERDAELARLLNGEVDATQKAVQKQIDARKGFKTFMEGIGVDAMLDDAMFGGAEKLKKLNFSPTDAKLAAAELKLYEHAVKRLVDQLGDLNKQSEREKLNFELFGQAFKTADGEVVHLTGNLEKLTPTHKAMLQIIAAEIDKRKDLLFVSKLHAEAYDALYKSQQQLLSLQTSVFQSDKEYVEDLRFQISLLGKTNIEQTKLNELRKIDVKLRNDLKAAADAAGDNMAQYDAARDALMRQAEDQRAAVIQAVNDRTTAERDWLLGATDAFNQYIDHARNAAETSRNFFTHTFNSMEDALVEFARTGKLDFKKLADSIISDIIRIQVRMAMTNALQSAQGSNSGSSIFGFLGRMLGFGASAPLVSEMVPGQFSLANPAFGAHGLAFDTDGLQAFAQGGLISAPTRFRFADGGMMRNGIAGEAGPEGIFPLTRINGRLGIAAQGGGGDISIVINQDNRGADASILARVEQSNEKLRRDIPYIVSDATRRGGAVRKVMHR